MYLVTLSPIMFWAVGGAVTALLRSDGIHTLSRGE